ncbi:MAG: hypothetical protein JW732_04215 [Dehalococcoidia bacterium]|nr:hypothetical protein [Dehalococcoidia bacterium]
MKGLIFIGLNVADAYLTKMSLQLGAIELNPLGALWSNMVIKAIAATAIVIGLCVWRKQSTLGPLYLVMFGICSWSLVMCFTLQVYNQAFLW